MRSAMFAAADDADVDLTRDGVRGADWHDEDAHGQIGDGQAHDEHIGNL